MLDSIHELTEVWDDFQKFYSHAILISYQFHKSAIFTVAHLNVELVFRTPREVVPILVSFQFQNHSQNDLLDNMLRQVSQFFQIFDFLRSFFLVFVSHPSNFDLLHDKHFFVILPPNQSGLTEVVKSLFPTKISHFTEFG